MFEIIRTKSKFVGNYYYKWIINSWIAESNRTKPMHQRRGRQMAEKGVFVIVGKLWLFEEFFFFFFLIRNKTTAQCDGSSFCETLNQIAKIFFSFPFPFGVSNSSFPTLRPLVGPKPSNHMPILDYSLDLTE